MRVLCGEKTWQKLLVTSLAPKMKRKDGGSGKDVTSALQLLRGQVL